MNVVSYRHYLDLLENKPGSPLFQKVLVFVLIVALIGIGTISAAFYKYRKEVPIRAQYQYLQSTNTDFESSKQSLKEVLSSFKVAGDKVSIVDSLQNEPNPSSGFFVALDDLEKNLSKIEATNVNVQTKKINTEGNVVPSKLVDLNNQILDFYSQSSQIMSDLYKDHLFAKEMLLASGPKFYLPVLTDEKLWEKGDKEEILNYYKGTKEEANVALANLSRLSPPPYFEDYYKAQVAYLTILVSLSDNIINTLAVTDDTNKDSATQIEKAYQLLVGAKRENEELSKKLLEEKLKLVDIRENLNKFAPIEIKENSIQENLDLAFGETPKIGPPNYYLNLIFSKILSL